MPKHVRFSIVESVEQDHVGEILREITKLVDQGKLKQFDSSSSVAWFRLMTMQKTRVQQEK